MNSLAIIGIGNTAAADEGIGSHIVENLPKYYDCSHVDVYNLETSVFKLVHILMEKEKAIIVDCAFMQSAPGTIKKFSPGDVMSLKKLSQFSISEGDILAIIDTVRRIAVLPEEIILFGVEPFSIEMGKALTDNMKKKIGEYISVIAECAGLKKLYRDA